MGFRDVGACDTGHEKSISVIRRRRTVVSASVPLVSMVRVRTIVPSSIGSIKKPRVSIGVVQIRVIRICADPYAN